jgi:hypothetical protein
MGRIEKRRGAAGPAVRDRRDHASRLRLLTLIRDEFDALPALRLTAPQITRMFGLQPDVCTRVLATLVRDNVLSLADDGRYTRCDRGHWQGPHNPPWTPTGG